VGRVFENPWVLLIIIIVVVLLFAAPKLPGMARSLGQSMRIIKSEVKEMKNDGKTPDAPAASTEAPVEGKIVNNPPQAGTSNPGEGTTNGTNNPA
jgi:sec-independent protein translocase protein TatA